MRLCKLVGENIGPHNLDQAEFVPHHYANVYEFESGLSFERLRIGLADKHIEFVVRIVEKLTPDFIELILHQTYNQ